MDIATQPLIEQIEKQQKEIEILKELLEFHKGISEAKSIIINDLEKQIKEITYAR